MPVEVVMLIPQQLLRLLMAVWQDLQEGNWGFVFDVFGYPYSLILTSPFFSFSWKFYCIIFKTFKLSEKNSFMGLISYSDLW